MNKIIKTFNSNIKEIFLIYIIFGLSIAIFLKDINLTYLKLPFFETIYLYRIVLLIFSLYLLLKIKKKFNFNIFLLSLVSLIFLYNTLFGELLTFSINMKILFEKFNIIPDYFIYTERINTLIINFINIYLPLFVLMLVRFDIDLNLFYRISYKLCEIFIILLSIYIAITLISIIYFPEQTEPPHFGPPHNVTLPTNANIKFKYFGAQSEFGKNFINPHGLFYFLNIFFIQNIIQIFNKINVKKNLLYIVVILILFLISGSILFLGLSALTFLIYSAFKLKKTYFYLLSILFLFSIIAIYLNILNEGEIIHGSLYNSLNIRITYIKFFTFDVNNINFIYGSNIFSDQIYTYPHNSLIDIFLCTGFLGLLVLSYVFLKIVNFYRINYQSTYNFIILILFQLSIFSLLSGFFFKNIALNILIGIMLNLSNVKHEKIK